MLDIIYADNANVELVVKILKTQKYVVVEGVEHDQLYDAARISCFFPDAAKKEWFTFLWDNGWFRRSFVIGMIFVLPEKHLSDLMVIAEINRDPKLIEAIERIKCKMDKHGARPKSQNCGSFMRMGNSSNDPNRNLK